MSFVPVDVSKKPPAISTSGTGRIKQGNAFPKPGATPVDRESRICRKGTISGFVRK
jgi:hypothetical protein